MNNNKKFLTEILGYFVLFLICFFAFGGLLTKHPIYSHETPNLYFRICEYAEEFRHYGFPPVIFPNVIQSGGFAFPAFYPPLSYYFSTALFLMLKDAVLAAHVSLFLSVVFSVWAMYYSFKKIMQSFAAFIAATIYPVFPYRFIDTHVRAALGESWTFIWYPVIFTGAFLLIRKNNSKGIVMLSVGSAGLMLTHSVMGMYFLFFLIILFVAGVLFLKKWNSILPALWSGVLAIGLCGWFIFPQLGMWDKVRATSGLLMGGSREHVIINKPDFAQLFFSSSESWNVNNIKHYQNGINNNIMSFEAGFAYLISLGVFFAFLYYKKQRDMGDSINTTFVYLSLFATVVSLAFVVYPKPLISALPLQFSMIQYPWRVLGISLFFACTLLGLALDGIDLKKNYQPPLIAMFVTIACLSLNPLFKSIFYLNNPPQKFDPSSYIPLGNTGFVDLHEYAPRDWNMEKNVSILTENKVKVAEGVKYRWIDSETKTRKFEIESPTASKAIIPLSFYPIWSIRNQNGNELQQTSVDGLINIDIPAGNHIITISRIQPPYSVMGLIVSVIACVFIVLTAFLLRRKRSWRDKSVSYSI